jgi:hypothetical protein
VTAFQQLAYMQVISQAANQLQQVISLMANVNTCMGQLQTIQARITGSLTTPDHQFGTAAQADVDQINTFLAQWTTVQAQPLSFQQAAAAFLSDPPQV